MDKGVKQHPSKGILVFIATLFILSSNAFARTQVIDANIDSVEPIYMNYKIEKLIKPCQSMTIGCWNISYQKRVLKSLQGYRVKLSFEGQQFTITISMGLYHTDLFPIANLRDLFFVTDKALYESKANGRDRLTLATRM